MKPCHFKTTGIILLRQPIQDKQVLALLLIVTLVQTCQDCFFHALKFHSKNLSNGTSVFLLNKFSNGRHSDNTQFSTEASCILHYFRNKYSLQSRLSCQLLIASVGLYKIISLLYVLGFNKFQKQLWFWLQLQSVDGSVDSLH